MCVCVWEKRRERRKGADYYVLGEWSYFFSRKLESLALTPFSLNVRSFKQDGWVWFPALLGLIHGFFVFMLVFSVLNSNDVYMTSSGILASPSNVASFPAHETYQLFNWLLFLHVFNKKNNQIIREYFLVKVKYSLFNICAGLLNHDFADILLLDNVTGPLLIECVFL